MGNQYSFNCKMVQRSKGQSAVAAAAYQAGEKLRDQRTGRKYQYHKKKQGVAWSEILVPENSPIWATERGELWNRVEAAEKRVDGQAARRIILALPKELSDHHRQEFARRYIQEQFVDRGMVADYSIHLPCPKKNNDNHHLHLLLTTRDIGPDGFGTKNRNWNQKKMLEDWREKWAAATNAALEKAGFKGMWDHRTLAEQGIDRLPQVHLGQSSLEMESRGQGTDRANRALRVDQANQLVKKMKEIDKELNNEKRIANGETGAQRATPSGSPGGKNKQQNQQIRGGDSGHEKGAAASFAAPTKKYNQEMDRHMDEKIKASPPPAPIPAEEWAASIAARRLRKAWEAEKKSLEFPSQELPSEQRKARRDLVERWDFLRDDRAIRIQMVSQNPATESRFYELKKVLRQVQEKEKDAAQALHFFTIQRAELRPWQLFEKKKVEEEIRQREEIIKTAREKLARIERESAALVAAITSEKVERYLWQLEEKREQEKRALLALEAQQKLEAARREEERERKRQEWALKPKAKMKKSYTPMG
jgi:hypothetical protein